MNSCGFTATPIVCFEITADGAYVTVLIDLQPVILGFTQAELRVLMACWHGVGDFSNVPRDDRIKFTQSGIEYLRTRFPS